MHEEPKQTDPRATSRRELLKNAGILTGAVTAATFVAESVMAQDQEKDRPGEQRGRQDQEKDRPGGQRGRLPLETPVAQMRLSERELEKLTPAAKRLTKGDLIALGVALGRWPAEGIQVQRPTIAQAQRLTVEDVRSIEAAFTPLAAAVGPAALDISCCCCTPCCCAAAVIQTAPAVA